MAKERASRQREDRTQVGREVTETDTGRTPARARAKPEDRTVPVADLRPWDKNPNRHSPMQLREISESIKRFGWADRILVRPNMEVIAGHGRLMVAKRLGMSHVEVRVMDLDEADAHRLALAHNEVAKHSDINAVLQAHLVESLGDVPGFDLPDVASEVAGLDDDIEDVNLSEPVFLVEVRGPLRAQSDVLETLRKHLESLPGAAEFTVYVEVK